MQRTLFDLEPAVLTVSQLTADIKTILEQGFADVWVTGEVSGLTRAGSGHIYFSLKEKNLAVIRCSIWKSTAYRLRYLPEEGHEVIVRGRLNVYAPRGDYSLAIDEVQPRGQGAAELALRKLKEKLAQLGYFAPQRKKALPKFPRRLALVTSPKGAAVRDMLEILGRRWPCAEVLVCPARVQGPGAPQDIVRALQLVNRVRGVDVILLGRGGGSAEDLHAFNEEIVAQAIFHSKVPVVAAVGHEIDVTIADLVADRRALTPSEAAEIATPDQQEWRRQLDMRGKRLHDLLQRRLRWLRERLDGIGERRVFRQPLDHVRDLERRLDDTEAKLRRALKNDFALERRRLEGFAGRLHSLSPLQVLARGYSLTRTEPAGRLVHSVQQVKAGDALEIRVSDGRIHARAEAIE